jgi:3-deoxy-D-manno-octulosonic-acid transferase
MGLPKETALAAWLGAKLARTGRGPLLIAGSVIAGEEDAILEALAIVEQKWPRALLVMAPRKPERFDEAAKIIEGSGRSVVRRSDLVFDDTSLPGTSLDGAAGGARNVLLLDTIGELAALYILADAVFIGGSLVPAGGHNPLEPAAVGKTPAFGPAMENFREISATLLAANAAIQVHDGAELGAQWTALLSDPRRNAAMGQAALEVVARHRGATAATVDRIEMLLAIAELQAQARP